MVDSLPDIANNPNRCSIQGQLSDQLDHNLGHVLILIYQNVLKVIEELGYGCA
ncbi:hypothetical protein D3C76_1096760 [compost metagenome]